MPKSFFCRVNFTSNTTCLRLSLSQVPDRMNAEVSVVCHNQRRFFACVDHFLGHVRHKGDLRHCTACYNAKFFQHLHKSQLEMLNEARKTETHFKTEYSKSIFQNRNSISHFLFFSAQYMQKYKQINKPIYAHCHNKE